MKILVAYSSITGNTKKVAQAINEVVKGNLVDIKENPDPNEYDSVILGYWADKGKADKLADKFIEKVSNKPCGVFATLGAYPDSEHAKKVINYGIEALKENGCEVLSSFICQGKIDPSLTKRFENLDPSHPHYMDDARRKRHEDAKTHPDKNDLIQAKKAFENFNEDFERITTNGSI